MHILVTGPNGFIGKNLTNKLIEKGHKVLPFSRESSFNEIEDQIDDIDLIYHLAGENRPNDPKSFLQVNEKLLTRLCSLLKKSKRTTPIVFASSIHATKNTPYGTSKLAAEEILYKHSQETKSKVYIYRLPGVFGKWSEPNYNTVVATFCHNISRNIQIDISDPDKEISLVYIDDVIEEFIDITEHDLEFKKIKKIPTTKISLSKLAELIRTFKYSRKDLFVDNLSKGFIKKLYATYTTFIPKDDWLYDFASHSDERGIFAEVLKTSMSGQVSFCTIKPNKIRGEHYHHSKIEKFIVIHGEVTMLYKNIITEETVQFKLSENDFKVIESIPGWSHQIKNISNDDAKLIIWTNELFDPLKPDTYRYEI